MDSDIPKIIIKQALLYLNTEDMIYVDNHLFEDDVENEDDIEDDGQ